MSWNCDGPHYMAPALRVKTLGVGGITSVSMVLAFGSGYTVSNVFPPFGEILLMSNNTITTDTENDNLYDTLLPQKSIKIHTNSCDFLSTSFLFFKS